MTSLARAARSIPDDGSTVGLEADECWALLGDASLGRLAVRLGDGVDIFPVNFLVNEKILYFRSAPGTKLIDITDHPAVALEADGVVNRQRWSVVVHGKAERLGEDRTIERSGILDLQSYAPSTKWNYVKIEPVSITGRRFRRARRVGSRSAAANPE